MGREPADRRSSLEAPLSVSFEARNFPALLSYDQSLEIRVYNQDGVPAERIRIPFREMPWVPRRQGSATT